MPIDNIKSTWVRALHQAADAGGKLVTALDGLSKLNKLVLSIFDVFAKIFPTHPALETLKFVAINLKSFRSITFGLRIIDRIDNWINKEWPKTKLKLVNQITLTAARGVEFIMWLDSYSILQLGKFGENCLSQVPVLGPALSRSSPIGLVHNALTLVSSTTGIIHYAIGLNADRKTLKKATEDIVKYTNKESKLKAIVGDEEAIKQLKTKYERKIAESECDGRIEKWQRYIKCLNDGKNDILLESASKKIINRKLVTVNKQVDCNKKWMAIAYGVSKIAFILLGFAVTAAGVSTTLPCIIALGGLAISINTLMLARFIYEYYHRKPYTTLTSLNS